MIQGFGGFLLLLGDRDRGEGAGYMAGAGPGFTLVIFCLQIIIKIIIFNSIKKGPKLL